MEWSHGEHTLTDDPGRVDLDAVYALLQTAYWSRGRPRALIEKSFRHSICFSLYHSATGQQVGFARAVTDQATFTWICDVILHPDHRGRGLGKWMLQCLLEHPDLQTLSHHLRTKDAHGLYEQFGFERIEALRQSAKANP